MSGGEVDDEDDDDLILVEPRGNGLMLLEDKTLSKSVIDTKLSLGPILNALGGVETLNDKLFPYLNSGDLFVLCCCSRALWTLISADDGLWRELALNELSDEQLDARLLLKFTDWQSVVAGRRYRKRKMGRLFSDAVHRPLHCGRAKIDPFWLNRDNVAREKQKITVEQFIERYETTRTPVVLSGFEGHFIQGIERWKKGLQSGMTSLHTSGRFRCGARSISSESFAAYSSSPLAAHDESPLYIFDAKFAETFPQLAQDYEVPIVFKGEARDLFEYLGPKRRPDYRWIIAGAAKSGSKWHVDPNCTHAWNLSMKGKKKWLMLPPWGAPPPGVFPSPDGGSVAQPVSLMEWFLEFYKTTRKTREKQLIEFIADVGDLVFVPRNWWHAVLNIEESFAVTQNYVSTTNLPRALRFFQEKPDQVSGLSRCGMAVDRRHTFLQEFLDVLPERFKFTPSQAGESSHIPPPSVSWSSLVPKQDLRTGSSSFSFGFEVNNDDML